MVDGGDGRPRAGVQGVASDHLLCNCDGPRGRLRNDVDDAQAGERRHADAGEGLHDWRQVVIGNEPGMTNGDHGYSVSRENELDFGEGLRPVRSLAPEVEVRLVEKHRPRRQEGEASAGHASLGGGER
jgi:hypothetical protein